MDLCICVFMCGCVCVFMFINKYTNVALCIYGNMEIHKSIVLIISSIHHSP